MSPSASLLCALGWTDWSAIPAGEGGVRVNAFVAGGFLPPAVRGTKHEGLV